MPVKFRCSECTQKLRIEDAYIGKQVACVRCGAKQKVPAESAPEFAEPKATKSPPARPAAKPSPPAAPKPPVKTESKPPAKAAPVKPVAPPPVPPPAPPKRPVFQSSATEEMPVVEPELPPVVEPFVPFRPKSRQKPAPPAPAEPRPTPTRAPLPSEATPPVPPPLPPVPPLPLADVWHPAEPAADLPPVDFQRIFDDDDEEAEDDDDRAIPVVVDPESEREAVPVASEPVAAERAEANFDLPYESSTREWDGPRELAMPVESELHEAHAAAPHPEPSMVRPPLKMDVEDLIDMTAMVDIVFFLLIFFLVTSMHSLDSTIPMPAPDPQKGATKEPQTVAAIDADENYIVVRIDKNDKITVEGAEVRTERELLFKLRDLRSGAARPEKLMVIGHGEATHGTAVMIMDAGRELGMDQVKLSVQDEEE
ncbi:MAG: biopolymer transporter ExbD [Planctomycetes bacterium]|nr:biopolymer transporter ExbD [Planctomycetota bacterium]